MTQFIKRNLKSIIFIGLLVIFITSMYCIYRYFEYLSIAYLIEHFHAFKEKVSKSYFFYYLAFFLLYFFISVFALPVAALLCLLIGALFGFFPGILLASFASSLGALSCFFIARFLFRDFIEKKFKKSLKVINQGISKDGIFYLFFVRMTPIFPFFLINVLFSVTKIKPKNFYFVSQLGMFLGTSLFINAGTQLSKINTINDVLNKHIIVSLVLIAIIPLLIRKSLDFLKRKKYI